MNIIQGISNIVNAVNRTVEEVNDGLNRANNMGEGLEKFIKYHCCGLTGDESDDEIKVRQNEVFSYLGNKNNPPDAIFRSGDALEIKKTQSSSSNLQLNSSHPKDRLLITDPKISQACRDCEEWTEKDIFYVVGEVKKETIKSLWVIQGLCYSATQETYKKVERIVKEAVEGADDLEFSRNTKELAVIRNVDPLNASSLRVRGMWLLKHPAKLFEDIFSSSTTTLFQLNALMLSDKYLSFSEKDRLALTQNRNVTIRQVQIMNPNNPAQLLKAIHIRFEVF